jgi:hypothetical protein
LAAGKLCKRTLVIRIAPRSCCLLHRCTAALLLLITSATPHHSTPLHTPSPFCDHPLPTYNSTHIQQTYRRRHALQVQGRAPLREAQGRGRAHSPEVQRPHSRTSACSSLRQEQPADSNRLFARRLRSPISRPSTRRSTWFPPISLSASLST